MEYVYPSVEYENALLGQLFAPRDKGSTSHIKCRLHLPATITIPECVDTLNPFTRTTLSYKSNGDGSHSLTCFYNEVAKAASHMFNQGVRVWDSTAKREIVRQMITDKNQTSILIDSIVNARFTPERISETVQELLELEAPPAFEESKLRLTLSQFEQLRSLYRHRLLEASDASVPRNALEGSAGLQGTVSNIHVIHLAAGKERRA